MILTMLYRMLLAISLTVCLHALPLKIQIVTNCHNMTKPNGLPDEIWLQLKPKLCQGQGKVRLNDAPELCTELTGNEKHHPACQVWKRQQKLSKPNAMPLKSPSIHGNDRKLVLDCFMKSTRLHSQNDSMCSEMFSKHLTADKAQDALAYYKVLSQFASEIDWCLKLEEQMVPIPSNCSFLDEHELVEHCYMYHQFDRYPPCEHISWPKVALPVDVKTMYIYKTWQDIDYDFEYQLEEYRMGMEGIPDPMAVVMFCLHNNTWTDESNHQCFKVVKPKKDSAYSAQDRLYQKIYNQKRRDQVRYDCRTFHKKEKLQKCKNITWR